VLSLTSAHSFDLEDAAHYLHSSSVRTLLVQALCAAPMFGVRWRWVAGVALALPRYRGGKKVPPQIARMNAEDLLAAVFPDQVACAENLSGELEIPEHPLVTQTVRDCLEEAMDIEGFERLLRALEAGTIRIVARDLTEPSPLALEVLTARPYAYLDDAPLEERRTQAVMSRRWLDPESAADIGRLDPEAIERVRGQAWPDAATPDELHDALLWLGFLSVAEVRANAAWQTLIEALAADERVLKVAPQESAEVWIAAERRELFLSLNDEATREGAWVEIVRGRLEGLGPVTAQSMAASLSVAVTHIERALLALQAEGFAMRGRFTAAASVDEWCERRLLARIHRYTVNRLRAEIEPLPARDFLRFLIEWQRVAPAARMQGPDAVAAVLGQLEGCELPAGAWETEILPARISEYEPAWLDEHCLAGRFVWTRLAARASDPERGAAPVRATPIALIARRNLKLWSALTTPPPSEQLTASARAIADCLESEGASFFDDLVESAHLLPTQVEAGIAELVALGLVNSDSFGGLRALLVPADKRKSAGGARRRRRLAVFDMADAGRWSLVRRPALPESEARRAGTDSDAVEHVVRILLRRWGVLFWSVLAREAHWLPPWRDLLRSCRRLEARGEIRGGRFVAGFSGEQYATPDAVGLLRDIRRKTHDGALLSLSAADPLNLIGILTPGARLPALTGNRLLYRDGLPVAVLAAGEVKFMQELDAKDAWQAHNVLLRRHVPALLADLA
jgi:ATP-dependent helicase Lhr and Lhr-like helicase